MKRALSGLAPPTRRDGDEALSALLFEALARASREEADTLTHGFHAWPARMHPAIAATVIDGARVSGATVLDPFCGGGTVLVEARVRGRPAVGIDLNPLALRVAEVKVDVRDAPARARFLEQAHAVAQASRERVKGRVKVRAPLSPRQASHWQPHVLLELGGLREEIASVIDQRDRRALEVVLSSILVKVSRARSDTDARDHEKRIGRYLSTELFLRKAQELEERWAALAAACAAPPAPVALHQRDARTLGDVVRPGSVALVLTSPPYGGTYDYAAHHAMRMPWLGLDDRALRQGELGARRSATTASWDVDVAAVLSALGRALAPGGLLVLVIGDAEPGGTRVPADAQVTRLASRAGLRMVASAAAPRPDRRGGDAREEHLLALTPV
ncbi:MAG: hypothetical protein IT383_27515 [Deltaproteobacteria bacterium]|nr:hypothetical protein [Deltaproteobacteria bacterium]